jgi:very-short-patch-repair endonuclease
MSKMTVEDYIDKYGEVRGREKYDQMQRRLDTRAKTYSAQPYRRLTAEWFVWRYGEEEGTRRSEEHAAKSVHSLENFVKRHGEEEGRRMYEQTMLKKNTVERSREIYGDRAEEIIAERYKRSVANRRKSFDKMTPSEREAAASQKSQRISASLTRKYKGKTKLGVFCEKYGDHEGPVKYAEYLQKVFTKIGYSSEATCLFQQLITRYPVLNTLTLFYRDNSDHSKMEWFISDSSGVMFYDFVVKETKTILEYDGFRWHPSVEQVEQYGDELMEITGISYKEKYLKDLAKRQKAIDKGFDVFVIRSDHTEEEKGEIMTRFIERVISKCSQ